MEQWRAWFMEQWRDLDCGAVAEDLGLRSRDSNYGPWSNHEGPGNQGEQATRVDQETRVEKKTHRAGSQGGAKYYYGG